MAKGFNFSFEVGVLESLADEMVSLQKGAAKFAEFVADKAAKNTIGKGAKVNDELNGLALLVKHDATRLGVMIVALRDKMKAELKK